jgi:hypothetical protein
LSFGPNRKRFYSGNFRSVVVVVVVVIVIVIVIVVVIVVVGRSLKRQGRHSFFRSRFKISVILIRTFHIAQLVTPFDPAFWIKNLILTHFKPIISTV